MNAMRSNSKGCLRKVDITYQFFGINPADFYSAKFAIDPPGDLLSSPVNKFHIDCDRARFLVDNIGGARVLDVGCGSAPFGKTIRSHTNAREFYGIDLDPACIEMARQSYDHCSVFDLSKGLPFDDEYFDCVFSMDVFGHIEFRHKNHLISEICRVTKRGGLSVHGIESGIINYELARPWESECQITKYVWQDGHVGVESATELRMRWTRFFSEVKIENAFVYPLLPFMAIKHMPMPDDLLDVFEKFSQEQIYAAQLVIGFLQRKLRSQVQRVDSTMLFPDDENPFSKHCGFVYLIATKV